MLFSDDVDPKLIEHLKSPSFAAYNFDEQIVQTLKKLGFRSPTNIQVCHLKLRSNECLRLCYFIVFNLPIITFVVGFVGCCLSKANDRRKWDCGLGNRKRKNIGISTSSHPASA